MVGDSQQISRAPEESRSVTKRGSLPLEVATKNQCNFMFVLNGQVQEVTFAPLRRGDPVVEQTESHFVGIPNIYKIR
jgi:hypothetical protein